MSPEFATAFDPALLEVLSIVDRARSGTVGSPEQEQARVRAAIERGGARLPGTRSKDWELASYALTSLADELLIADVSWPSQAWWENHKLEFAIFGSNNRATWFFDRAEQAVGLASRDALEAFMLVVVLGFRGMFRDRPDALDAWLRRQEQLVKVGHGRPALPDVGGDVSGAVPLGGRMSLLWASLATAMALACGVVATMAWLWSGRG